MDSPGSLSLGWKIGIAFLALLGLTVCIGIAKILCSCAGRRKSETSDAQGVEQGEDRRRLTSQEKDEREMHGARTTEDEYDGGVVHSGPGLRTALPNPITFMSSSTFFANPGCELPPTATAARVTTPHSPTEGGLGTNPRLSREAPLTDAPLDCSQPPQILINQDENRSPAQSRCSEPTQLPSHAHRWNFSSSGSLESSTCTESEYSTIPDFQELYARRPKPDYYSPRPPQLDLPDHVGQPVFAVALPGQDSLNSALFAVRLPERPAVAVRSRSATIVSHLSRATTRSTKSRRSSRPSSLGVPPVELPPLPAWVNRDAVRPVNISSSEDLTFQRPSPIVRRTSVLVESGTSKNALYVKQL